MERRSLDAATISMVRSAIAAAEQSWSSGAWPPVAVHKDASIACTCASCPSAHPASPCTCFSNRRAALGSYCRHGVFIIPQGHRDHGRVMADHRCLR